MSHPINGFQDRRLRPLGHPPVTSLPADPGKFAHFRSPNAVQARQEVAFAVDAVTYVVAALTVASLRMPFRASEGADRCAQVSRREQDPLLNTSDGRRGPGAIHGFILRPVQAQHQYELPVGGGQPVGLLVRSRELALDVQVG